ncbi:MAG: SDR family NAD-dependent epimerase/dehydratase, partial [Bacteroidaceae bacterium]|nr:SDR family NAD-dependent epimerase/dehydratase [Bacteroidaceae bacterium]
DEPGTTTDPVKKVIELTGAKSKIIFQPLPQDDPRQRKPDISVARRELSGWQPEVQLTEGLQRTIEYFKKLV